MLLSKKKYKRLSNFEQVPFSWKNIKFVLFMLFLVFFKYFCDSFIFLKQRDHLPLLYMYLCEREVYLCV